MGQFEHLKGLDPGKYPAHLKARDGVEYDGFLSVAPSGNVTFYDDLMDVVTLVDDGNQYIETVELATTS